MATAAEVRQALRVLLCCAVLFAAGFALGGCSGKPVADHTTTILDCAEVGGCVGTTGPTQTLSGPTVREAGETDLCREVGGCTAYAYVDEAGRLFICSDLRLVLRPNLDQRVAPIRTIPVLTARLTLTAVTVTTTTETQSLTVETVPRTQLLTRPFCPPSAKTLPVVGLDADAIGGLQRSEDGKTAWTTTKVRLNGHVADGKFVASP